MWPPGGVDSQPTQTRNWRGVPIWGFVLAGLCLLIAIGLMVTVPVLQDRAHDRERRRELDLTCQEMATRVVGPDHSIGDDAWLDAYAGCVTGLRNN